jgi:hypothetical protein
LGEIEDAFAVRVAGAVVGLTDGLDDVLLIALVDADNP